MLYTNRDCFIVSSPGCMYAKSNSLEAIMAGNEAGASGCTIVLDITQDGIIVLCEKGGFRGRDGTFRAVNECDFTELREFYPKIATIGQAVELAKSCAAKICVQLSNPAVCAQAKITLSHADYLDNAYFCGLNLADAGRLARRHPNLHMMGDLPGLPPSVPQLIRAAQDAGLFGLRAAPADLNEELCDAARRGGLFVASTESSFESDLSRMMALGVNFIETERPDLAYSLLPTTDATADF